MRTPHADRRGLSFVARSTEREAFSYGFSATGSVRIAGSDRLRDAAESQKLSDAVLSGRNFQEVYPRNHFGFHQLLIQ